MATAFNDFINNEFIPRLYENLDVAFPELRFVRRGAKWCSPLKKDGTTPRTPTAEKTVIKEKTPYLIFEGGEAPEEILKWIVRQYGYKSPYEAAQAVGQRIGITPPEFNSGDYTAYQQKIEAYQAAADAMQGALFAPENAAILSQLTEGRGYTIEEIKQMGLGCITPDIAERYRESVFLPYGVEYYNQIVIPFISGGRIEGFKFRQTDDRAKAKYINSKFSKSAVLFGLSAIPRSGEAMADRQIILVDGELKALYMSVKGFNNVVSGAGSDRVIISEEQIKQAKTKGVRHVIIIADNESTEQERKNEAKKIESTLQMLNRAGLSGYVVYLPQEDLTHKEDVEDYIRKYGADQLRQYVNDPESGAAFRTRLICQKYGEQQGESDQLTAIQINNLYADLFGLMSEYNGTDLAFIESTAKAILKDAAPEWIEVIKNGAKAKKAQAQAQAQEVEARKILAEADEALKRGDYKGALNIARRAQDVLQTDKAAEFSPMFAPRKWSDTTDKLRQRKIGIDTLFKFKRGRETDLLTLPVGGLSIFAAPTNHGKSTMLQNIAIQAAQDSKQQGAILYFTFEEDPESVNVQFLSKLIGKPISRDNKRSIKSYYLGNTQFITDIEAFKAGEAKLAKLTESGKLWIFGTEANNGVTIDVLSNLIQMITQATKEIPQGVAAVFIDYVQLIAPDERIKNRAEELKIICTELKNLAVRLGLPIVMAAQFSREGSKSPYELEAESLGEGGDIERAAALIVGMWNTGKKPRQNSKFDADNKIWKNDTGERNFAITFDESHPQIYARILKSRGEATGGEALLDCDLNVGIIKANTTRQEIAQIRNADAPKPVQGIFPEMNTQTDVELPF